MNDLNRGKVAVGISLKVFEELIQKLQEENLLNGLNTQQSFSLIEGNSTLSVTAHINVELLPVKFTLNTKNGNKYTRLEIEGRAKLKVSSPTAESPNLFDLPFSIKLNIGLALKTRNNKGPALCLQYNGIDALSGPIPEEKVLEMINAPAFTSFLNNFELDVIDPAIDGLEDVLFLNESKPNRANWEVGLHLLSGSGNNVDCVALIVDVPGGNVQKPTGGSFVPNKAEIIVQFTNSMIQALVTEAKEELKSWFEQINGVDLRVSRLELSVDNNQLYLDAKMVEKEYDADVRIYGPITFNHAPGSMQIALNVRGLKTDIDLPWWADLLLWIIDVLTIGMAGANDLVHNKIPNMGQTYLQNTLDKMLPKLGESLSFENLSIQNATLEIYPDTIELDNGAVTIYVQVLIQKLIENLKEANYSRLRERFVMFHLVSGRRYMTADLARFIRKQLIEVPGYHEVGGRYVRSNPDNTENNNLLKRYQR